MKGQPQIEIILDKRISKKTRDKEYFQYLAKWKDHPSKDAWWMTTMDISTYNVNPKDLLKNYFLPQRMMQEHRVELLCLLNKQSMLFFCFRIFFLEVRDSCRLL